MATNTQRHIIFLGLFFIVTWTMVTSCDTPDSTGKVWQENSVIIGNLSFDGGKRSLKYTLEQDSLVRLRVWIDGGPLVATPVNGELRNKGARTEAWMAKDPSGRVPLMWGYKFHIEGLAVPSGEIDTGGSEVIQNIRDIPILLELKNMGDAGGLKGSVRVKESRPEGEKVSIKIFSDMKPYLDEISQTLPFNFNLPKFADDDIHFITANIIWPDGRMGTSSMIYHTPGIK